MRTLYLDCISGASGDMTVGALLDLGGDFDRLQAELAKLAIGDEFTVSREKVRRCGITATHFRVHVASEAAAAAGLEHGHDHPHDHEHEGGAHHGEEGHDHAEGGHHHHGAHGHDVRSHADIVEIIRRAGYNERTTAYALSMFDRIARAEAKIHGVPVESVHFHEVGAVDSIVDIVSIAVLVDMLSPDRIVASPLPLGGGKVRTQHGIYPVPAPATLEILAGVPTREESIQFELTTPTGAAAVATLAHSFGPLPAMTVETAGYGAGSKDFPDRPNVLRAVLGRSEGLDRPTPSEVTDAAQSTLLQAGAADEHIDAEMMKVEVNLDDISGEILGSLMERLLGAGANDVFYVPIYMKKNRPAVKLELLCASSRLPAIREIIFRETSTFGLRYHLFTAHRLGRRWRTVETPWGTVRVKEGIYGEEVVQQSPEYEDCRRIAEEHAVPLKRVFEAARRALE